MLRLLFRKQKVHKKTKQIVIKKQHKRNNNIIIRNISQFTSKLIINIKQKINIIFLIGKDR